MSDLTNLAKQAEDMVVEAVTHGILRERKRITKLAQDAICFDHIETANCDHAACFALDRLIAKINKEQTSA